MGKSHELSDGATKKSKAIKMDFQFRSKSIRAQ